MKRRPRPSPRPLASLRRKPPHGEAAPVSSIGLKPPEDQTRRLGGRNGQGRRAVRLGLQSPLQPRGQLVGPPASPSSTPCLWLACLPLGPARSRHQLPRLVDLGGLDDDQVLGHGVDDTPEVLALVLLRDEDRDLVRLARHALVLGKCVARNRVASGRGQTGEGRVRGVPSSIYPRQGKGPCAEPPSISLNQCALLIGIDASVVPWDTLFLPPVSSLPPGSHLHRGSQPVLVPLLLGPPVRVRAGVHDVDSLLIHVRPPDHPLVVHLLQTQAQLLEGQRVFRQDDAGVGWGWGEGLSERWVLP